MYCTKCETLVSNDAKFCAKCGTPVNETSPDNPIEAMAAPVALTKPGIIWLYIVGILLFGVYAALLIPAFGGKAINPLSGYYLMFWNGLFFYLLWKRLARKGWHGVLIGMVIGILAFFVAAFISGYVR